MVKLELDMSLEDFEARRELFEAKLTEKLGAQVRIASVTVLEEEARRKKRETKKRYLTEQHSSLSPQTLFWLEAKENANIAGFDLHNNKIVNSCKKNDEDVSFLERLLEQTVSKFLAGTLAQFSNTA